MTKCPKCGSVNIIGPKYHPAAYISLYGEFGHTRPECLGYTCAQCGYTATTPTNDAQESPR